MRIERFGMVYLLRQFLGVVSFVVGVSLKIKYKCWVSGGGGWLFLFKSSSKEYIEQMGFIGILN